jgi:C4-type Zn-finger protein
MSEPVISTCCGAETEVISYHVAKVHAGEILDTGYKCLKCGHKFHIWSDSKTNKLAPELTNREKTDGK